MVKFLSGGQFSGADVPLCSFWRNDLRTDPSKELSELEGTGQSFAQRGKGKDSAIGSFTGQCVANAFYPASTITCFNAGACNGEGKCITCSRYRYGGIRMAITHSPPVDSLRFFEKGLTEAEIQSPNLVKFPPNAVQEIEQNQVPYHILIRNIQAEIAKCCHWNAGDGAPSRFFLAETVDGPHTTTITDTSGNTANVKGIRVTNTALPDEVGTFFPVGTVVVAGFEDQPSFYLEPRTGLIKDGEGVIHTFGGGGAANPPYTVVAKQIASDANTIVDNAVNASLIACQAAQNNLSDETNFYNNALATNDSQTIAAASARLSAATSDKNTSCNASTSATTLGNEAISLIADVIQSDTTSDLQTNADDLADKLEELADAVETAGSTVGGTAAAAQVARQVFLLRRSVRHLKFSASGARTKCEFFFQDSNNAAQWNSPVDGSLPCNGVRTDCPFYTGETWNYASDEKMGIGKPILAEQIQEVRFRSEDWSKFSDPNQEFRNRFTTPFVWAFKDYVTVVGEPSLEDMLLYKPQVLYSRGTPYKSYETIRVEKVEISDFDDFALSKSTSRIQPGVEVLDKSQATAFPSIISEPLVPSATRLSITHPREQDLPFIYRIWSPENNKITIFGKASPDNDVYIINNTALQNRLRYHLEFGTKDFFDVPRGLPKAPDFLGITSTELLDVIRPLRDEKATNQGIEAPLGFDEVSSDREGFWQSIQEVDLVHNAVNEIYAFVIASETSVLVAHTRVDCRFLHSVVAQTSFEGKDFSLYNTGAGSTSMLGSNVSDTAQKGTIVAEPQQIIGSSTEQLKFAYGYFAWKFKDRDLRFGTLNADNDLQGQNQIADTDSPYLVTEANASAFISNVSYNVVQYQKLDVVIDDWYLINDCGFIMLVLDDVNLHRVLPLTDQQGDQKALESILVNGGSTGSEIAQWGLLSATLETESGTVELIQVYRDPDGLGLPANYVVVGPNVAAFGDSALGRPDPGTDTITVSYTFLRAQSTKHDPDGSSINPEDEPIIENAEVVTSNFYNDTLRTHKHAVSFDSATGILTAGGSTANDRISSDQQDYVFVFADSAGRPIGKKFTRMYVMYYNLACVNVEIFYRWSADCTTYALIPDVSLRVGDAGGTLLRPPDATEDPNDERLLLGSRIQNLLGDRDCLSTPNCGDHEFLSLGPLRREFEVIVRVGEGDDSYLKANFPSAGQALEGEIISSEPPGSQFLRRHGPMWYPYTVCERPRYRFNTNGPLRTDSTELINTTLVNPGIVQDGKAVAINGAATFEGQGGVFGGLPNRELEAYHGPDQVVPKILDIHPSLTACTSAYTYGNQVIKSGENRFAGYARRRGALDLFLYEGLRWTTPPFGNFGRPRLVFELSNERGDFVGGFTGAQVGRRWMPLFPTRENLGSSIGLFGETLEPQGYRLVTTKTPYSSLTEAVQTASIEGNLIVLGAPRYNHKAIIANRTLGGIEFPYVPYFPMFLPDDSLGQDPGAENRVPIEEGSKIGPISTMWAWREQEKRIQRGVTGLYVIPGVVLQAPDYFIDNRRLEVQLRPAEGNYSLIWTPPKYNSDGSLAQNASIRLGNSGPPREIVIDFENRIFAPAYQEDTVYDTTKELGEGAFECEEGTPTDNLQLASTCSCITDITDASLQNSSSLPSRFLHLDELAPAGYFTLYEGEELQTPFAVDLLRTDNTEPCCQCLYYIRGIFVHLNSSYIPAETGIDPTFHTGVDFRYTWSRVPHGLNTNLGVDGIFGAKEQLGDALVDFDVGEVFVTRVPDTRSRLDPAGDGGAFFPCSSLAAQQAAAETGIKVVGGFSSGDPRLKGGLAVDSDKNSRGEDENITLSMVFDTYVRITEVEVTFYAGVGFEGPKYSLAVVPVANRTGSLVTTNASVTVGETTAFAVGGNIPNRNTLDEADIQDGRAKFVSNMVPVYDDLPFWEAYGMEWQLIFQRRGAAQSMGIASVVLTVDALAEGSSNTEVVGIRERKYYRSSAIIANDMNPERFLGELDSATAYWRTTERGPVKGHNRHRAYAWGQQIEDNQDRVRSSDITYLESLQAQEYDNARALFGAPYQFAFTSFIPLDEQKWLNLLNEPGPSWTLTLANEVSAADKVTLQGSQTLLYGEIPKRTNFNAPGHAWVHNFEETYAPCCFGCVHSQVINYDFLHLHDNLALVETSSFWAELPSGFTRLIRSTIMLPDPTFQGGETGVGSVVLVDEAQFTDQDGNPISTEVLEAAGFTRDPTTGQVYVDSSQPDSGVGGPAGPS